MHTLDDIHIGALIQQQVKAKQFSTAQLAAALACKRQNIYNIYRRKSIDTDLLVRISTILGYDFLSNVYLPLMPNRKVEIGLTIEIRGETCIVKQKQ